MLSFLRYVRFKDKLEHNDIYYINYAELLKYFWKMFTRQKWSWVQILAMTRKQIFCSLKLLQLRLD